MLLLENKADICGSKFSAAVLISTLILISILDALLSQYFFEYLISFITPQDTTSGAPSLVSEIEKARKSIQQTLTQVEYFIKYIIQGRIKYKIFH